MVDLKQIAYDVFEYAKKIKTERPKDEEFQPVAILVYEDGSQQLVPIGFSNPIEKRIKTGLVAVAAKHTGAAAVIVAMDAAVSTSVPFNKEEAMAAKDDPEKMKALKAKGDAWLSQHFEGSIKNMPEALREDAICVSMLGPGVPHFTLAARYTLQDGKPIFKETNEMAGGLFSMIPPWWDDKSYFTA